MSVNSQIYIRTPLIQSISLQKYSAGRKVFLKLENCQPSGSVKLRGVAAQIEFAKSTGSTKVICSSAGNAGLAAAYASLQLGIPCHIVIPKTTPGHIRDKIEQFGATVEVYGSSSEDVEARAEDLVRSALPEKYFLVQSSNHELLFAGNSTIIDEIAEDLGNQAPSLIVSCCGGGGLVSGLVQGVQRQGWELKTKIIVMETLGAHSFHVSVKAGGARASLERITSIAISLNVLQVDDQIRHCFNEAKPPLLSRVVTDSQAVSSCLKFADDHRILVGPACGSALPALYEGVVERILLNQEGEKEIMYDKVDPEFDGEEGEEEGPVVVIVCGGSEVTLESLMALKEQFNL